MKLEVPTDIFTEMVNHIRVTFPNEACGLLFGMIHNSGTQFIARTIQKFENISDKPEISFFIDPEEFYKALCFFEEKDLGLVAIYHSHRAPPVPSQSDRHYMEGYPGVVWLVFSTLSHSLDFLFAAFVLKQDNVLPVTVQIL